MENKKNELQKLFKKLKSENKTIIGFGAPAKATTFMYQFCIDEKILYLLPVTIHCLNFYV